VASKDEKSRLLAEVERLKREADLVYGKPENSYKFLDFTNIPLTGSSGTIYFGDPLTTFRQQAMTAAKNEQPEYAEIKIWRADGRVEIIRCVADQTTIVTPKGQMVPKPSEGDVVTFRARMKAWKFGPDGRPKP
jgi:hypothetical protein